MRDIKFRGMDINGNWHYGNLTILKQDIDSSRKAGCYISNSVGMPFAYYIRPETQGQFTGLRDKNGKEIYEGDIIHHYLGVDVVKWDVDGYTVGDWEPRGLEDFLHTCEVIGNIHEATK